MRRSLAIVKATALEILSEPLTLLILLAALVLTVVMPVFHYHQFGEATRMARDAGLSALFTCGSALAVFGTIRAFRREIESGTLEMALAHPVSRGGFFMAKACGALVAYAAFAFIVFAVTLVIVNGAEIGGIIAARTNDIARLWKVSFALGVATLVLPLIVGAALNRFGRFRFVLTSFVCAAALACASLFYCPSVRLYLRLAPAALLLGVMATLLLTAAAAFSVRFKANAAASCVGLVAVGMLPFVGNYYLAEALARGGSVPWAYVGLTTLVSLPAAGGFLLLGCHFSGNLE